MGVAGHPHFESVACIPSGIFSSLSKPGEGDCPSEVSLGNYILPQMEVHLSVLPMVEVRVWLGKE